MYILKNSFHNLIRNRSRNFLILLIALVTLTSVTLSFSVRALSNLAISRYKDSFGVRANIEVDWEKMEKEHPPEERVNSDGSITIEQNFAVPLPEAEEYEKYADSLYVKQIDYYASCVIYSDSLEAVPDNLEEGIEIIDIGGMDMESLMKFFGVSTKEELERAVGGKEELERLMDTKPNSIGSLIGITDISLIEDFSTGKRKLEQGFFPQNENECMIGRAFAEHNGLAIGDTISVSGQSKSMDKNEIQLTVTGIYGDYFNAVNAVMFGTDYGDIFTTYDTLMNTGFHYIDIIDAAFTLNDPESAELFEQELREKGLNEYHTLIYSTEEYENNTKPLADISHIAELFTITAGIIGAAILLLLSVIQVRERKYEIGVLRAMGMKKSSIASGMVYESLLMMFICFAVSAVFALLLTKPVAATLLGSLTDITIALPPIAIGLSAAMALVLSILSGICAVFAVMRNEPMNILIERN